MYALVIPSEQADANVTDSTPEHILADLNTIFKTSLSIDYIPLHSLIASFLSQGLDFGAIYARLRTSWPASNETNHHHYEFEAKLVRNVDAQESQGQ